jgi:hypothetical protein
MPTASLVLLDAATGKRILDVKGPVAAGPPDRIPGFPSALARVITV